MGFGSLGLESIESIGKSLNLDIKGNVNTFRQNLQTAYVTRLIAMINGEKTDRFIVPAQSMAIYNLKPLQKKLRSPKGDLVSVAHKTHLKTFIKNALEAVH